MRKSHASFKLLRQLDLRYPWLQPPLCLIDSHKVQTLVPHPSKRGPSTSEFSLWISHTGNVCSSKHNMHRLCVSSGVKNLRNGGTHFLKGLLESIVVFYHQVLCKQTAPEEKKNWLRELMVPFILTGAPLMTSWTIVGQSIAVFVTHASDFGHADGIPP